MTQRALVPVMMLLALFMSIDVFAREAEDSADNPSQALLEFLADFETDNGKWMDPFELLNMFDTGLPGKPKEAADDEKPYD